MKPAWTAIKSKARNRRSLRCSSRSNFYWHKPDGQRIFKSEAMSDASFESGGANAGTAGQLTATSRGIWYMYDQRGNLAMQGLTGPVDSSFAENEKTAHYYWLPNEFGDIVVGFDQGGQSFAVYTDHINTPRLVTLVSNPLNPVPITDTSNDLPAVGGGDIQGISPQAMPVWQMVYSAFGPDLANGYEARPTTINNNFKPDLWEWVGLPDMGGADDWSWYAGGGNGLSNGSVLTAPVLNIRYPGQYYDAESGLSQNWWRSYDARMGRYTQNDPIGLEGGMNRRIYAANDAINQYDSTGLTPVAIPFVAGGVGALICASTPGCRKAFSRPFQDAYDASKDTYNRAKCVMNGTCSSANDANSSSDTNDANSCPVPGTEPDDKTGRDDRRQKPGGMDIANEDFDNMNPTDVAPLPNDIGRRGKLPDGSDINVRDKSNDGRPTIEIQGPNGKRIKIRYY